MKILFAATPIAGHVNPLLAIARMAKARGDETIFATGTHLASAVEAAGCRFVRLAPGADLDLREPEKLFPERITLPPGPHRLLFDFKCAFVDTIAPQAETLRAVIAADAPDVIVTDGQFMGNLALLLDSSCKRPPVVSCGITFLSLDRPDCAPVVIGLPPARSEEERARYAAIRGEIDAAFTKPVQDYADAKLASMGLPELPCSFLSASILVPDAYLQPTVRAFEYDFGPLPSKIRFVGALPPPAAAAVRPEWWGELDDARRVVLVTQGTAANDDFSELVAPAITALAGRDDLLVVVTTGGRRAETIGVAIPPNARVASFLDYTALLPKIDVLVTNGGYGTVSLALQAGVPMVAAGRSEDKAEVGARVSWSGVGVELPTQRPSAEMLAEAVSRVLDEPSYRARARSMAADFAKLDTREAILGTLDALVANWVR